MTVHVTNAKNRKGYLTDDQFFEPARIIKPAPGKPMPDMKASDLLSRPPVRPIFTPADVAHVLFQINELIRNSGGIRSGKTMSNRCIRPHPHR